MNYQKKYLKYKEKYLLKKNQIGGMFKIGDKVREYDSMVTGVINNIYKIQEHDKDLRFQMLGDDGETYSFFAPHFVLLSSESPELKKDRDDERERRKLKNEQKKAQAIIDARRRGDFLRGDKVREYDSMVTGTITEIGKGLDPLITMLGDDGETYTYHSPHFGYLSFEYPVLKAERDNKRVDIKEKKKKREEKQRRIRRDFLVGDRVWEDGYFTPGKITSIDKNGNIEMLGDDGKVYSFEKKNIHFILKEETEEEKQRRIKDTKSFVEAKEAGRAGVARLP